MARLTKRVKRSKSRKSRKLHRKKIKGGQERMAYQRRVLQLLTGIGECVCKNGNFGQTTLGISTQGGKKTRKLSKKIRGGAWNWEYEMGLLHARFNNILKHLKNIRVEEIHAWYKLKPLKLPAEKLLEQIGNFSTRLEEMDRRDGVDTITPTVNLLNGIENINFDNIGDELPKILKEYDDSIASTQELVLETPGHETAAVKPKGAFGRVYRDAQNILNYNNN